MSKTTKNDDGALRAALAALSKRSTRELRESYEKTMKRPANGLSRSALVKTLCTKVEVEQPPPSHPTKEEQAKAKETATSKPDQRRTGARDPRLPKPGSTLTRAFKGKTHEVTVNETDFTYRGKPYRSLTAIALEISGYKAISGTAFFGIAKPAEKATAEKPAKVKAARKAKAK